MKTSVMELKKDQGTVITSEAMLSHWQGHRKLTRKVIEAFPEDKLFNYSIGGMRPFAELATEMIRMGQPGIDGLFTGEWVNMDSLSAPKTKQEMLALWDNITEKIDRIFPQISEDQFQKVDAAFGQWKNSNYGTLLYFIDNEIHHRGQGYVYLRSLGIEPPAFWDRG